MSATVILIDQMEWVEKVFRAAREQGGNVEVNRNGDRQIDFGNKCLTADHVRRVFQDIVKRKGVYTREDMNVLLAGSRPCATAPFFEVTVKAGLARMSEEKGEKFYRFDLANPHA